MNKTDEINHDELCARQLIIKQSSEVTRYRGTVAINDFGRHRWHPPIHLGGTAASSGDDSSRVVAGMSCKIHEIKPDVHRILAKCPALCPRDENLATNYTTLKRESVVAEESGKFNCGQFFGFHAYEFPFL